MGGRDGLFSLTVTYFLVLLWAADEASADGLLSLYLQQAFFHSGDVLLASPVSVQNYGRSVSSLRKLTSGT